VKQILLAATLLALLLAACTGASAEEGITVEDAWVRPAPVTGGNGAGYMVITNHTGEPDALIGASAGFAEMVEVHESVHMEGDTMSMHAVERIDIAPGESVRLEPGSYHIMLMGITEELQEGDTVELTLHFETAGDVTVQAPVREQ